MNSRAHEIEVSITIGDDPPVNLRGRVFDDGQRVVRTSHGLIAIPENPDHVDLYRNGVTAQKSTHTIIRQDGP